MMKKLDQKKILSKLKGIDPNTQVGVTRGKEETYSSWQQRVRKKIFVNKVFSGNTLTTAKKFANVTWQYLLKQDLVEEKEVFVNGRSTVFRIPNLEKLNEEILSS